MPYGLPESTQVREELVQPLNTEEIVALKKRFSFQEDASYSRASAVCTQLARDVMAHLAELDTDPLAPDEYAIELARNAVEIHGALNESLQLPSGEWRTDSLEAAAYATALNQIEAQEAASA